MHRAIIEGVGSYLPERVLTNEELARLVDTSDEWIVERTGIRERRIAAPGELTSDLAVAAATAALADANTSADEIDLVWLPPRRPIRHFPPPPPPSRRGSASPGARPSIFRRCVPASSTP
jgi:3-oxoacyl-[acyl-carrier-protein] synthase III